MKILYSLVIIGIVGLVGAVGIAYSGLYDVSASSPHSGIVNWLLSTTSHASIERRAGDVVVPDLTDDALALAGVSDFSSMCASCHGAPGQDPEAVGQGLNPQPPDLSESAEHMTPAELFWVTKHGIKMTGMPSWGATHGDETLWPVVAFMTELPDMDGGEYQALLARAAGMGHHAEDQGVDAGSTQADSSEDAEHDPSTHEH